jgi:hypothetical protein
LAGSPAAPGGFDWLMMARETSSSLSAEQQAERQVSESDDLNQSDGSADNPFPRNVFRNREQFFPFT